MTPTAKTMTGHAWRIALFATALVTAVRLALLPFYAAALGPDEAQYWFWGQELDWGYYSKPPMIAWVIALPTAIFGDHAWSVRLLSPVLIGGTGLFLFAAARRLYGAQAALWTLIVWHLVPAVMFGATIIATDVPLLFFWSAALYALVRLTEADAARPAWAVALGVAAGLGLLSKYAMIYFLPAILLALVLSPRMRRAGAGPLLGALAVAALVFSPNIVWNLGNGLQTVGHTADNADWRGGLAVGELAAFVTDQFGVFGPLLFGALVTGILLLPRTLKAAGPARGEDLMLVSFVLPPLLLISIQALLSRAHANWALTAYPAAAILVPIWLLRIRASWALWGTAALHGLVGILFTAALLDFRIADALGLQNAAKRTRGWDETAAGVTAAFEAGGYDTLLLDDRELAAHLVWELRETGIPIEVLDPNFEIDNTYEAAFPFTPEGGERLLLVTKADVTRPAYQVFSDILPVGEVFVDVQARTKGRPERLLDLWAVSGAQAGAAEAARRPSSAIFFTQGA